MPSEVGSLQLPEYVLKGRRAVVSKYQDFDYPPQSFYDRSAKATILRYKTREVKDENGQKWDIVEVNGYTTIPRSPDHRPVALMKIGACIPIVVNWSRNSGQVKFTTIMHQAGNRTSDEIENNIFEPLKKFCEELPSDGVVESCGIIHRDRPASDSPEDITEKLLHSLPMRFPTLHAPITEERISDAYLPYDLQFDGNDMVIFSRNRPELARAMFAKNFGEKCGTSIVFTYFR